MQFIIRDKTLLDAGFLAINTVPDCDSHRSDLHVMFNIQLFYTGAVDSCDECLDPTTNCVEQNDQKFKCCPPGTTGNNCMGKNLPPLFHRIGSGELLDVFHNDYCQSKTLCQSLNQKVFWVKWLVK